MALFIAQAPRPSDNREVYNELLISRGDLTPYLKILRHWADELAKDNECKEGTPYQYPTVLFQILSIEYNLGKSFRMVEGFARTVCGLLVFPAPRWSTIWYRLQTITLSSLFQDPPLVIQPKHINCAVDSSGLKLNGPGEYLDAKHHPSKKKEFVKFHILVDTRTHQVLVKTISPGFAHDSPFFRSIIERATHNYKIDHLWAEKAYGSHENYELLSVKQIVTGIPLKKNARTRTRGGSFARTRVAWKIKQIGLGAWKKMVGYGNRWAVERTFSIYKILFGEKLQSRK